MLLKGEVREIKEAQPFKNKLLFKTFEKFPARRFLFWVADFISSCPERSFILFVLLNIWILSRDVINYFALFNHLLNFNASDSIKKWKCYNEYFHVLQSVFIDFKSPLNRHTQCGRIDTSNRNLAPTERWNWSPY